VPFVATAGIVGLMQAYRRSTGFFVGGYRTGRTRGAVCAWSVGFLAVFAAGFALEEALDVRGAMVVAGAVLGVGIALFGRWWTRLYIAALREGL
jgi:hypothetical protein